MLIQAFYLRLICSKVTTPELKCHTNPQLNQNRIVWLHRKQHNLYAWLRISTKVILVTCCNLHTIEPLRYRSCHKPYILFSQFILTLLNFQCNEPTISLSLDIVLSRSNINGLPGNPFPHILLSSEAWHRAACFPSPSGLHPGCSCSGVASSR